MGGFIKRLELLRLGKLLLLLFRLALELRLLLLFTELCLDIIEDLPVGGGMGRIEVVMLLFKSKSSKLRSNK